MFLHEVKICLFLVFWCFCLFVYLFQILWRIVRILIGITLTLDSFWSDSHFHNINLPDPRPWEVFPYSDIVFNFILRYLTLLLFKSFTCLVRAIPSVFCFVLFWVFFVCLFWGDCERYCFPDFFTVCHLCIGKLSVHVCMCVNFVSWYFVESVYRSFLVGFLGSLVYKTICLKIKMPFLFLFCAHLFEAPLQVSYCQQGFEDYIG